MGHTRLGRLPRTRKWQEVVGLVGAGADTADIAAATLDASMRGLDDAARDPALVRSFWLLTQLPLCARKEDFIQELANVGVSITSEPTLMELVGGFSDAVDAHIYLKGGRTDWGEMAQMGAAETLTSILGQRTASLFGSTAEDVRRELARLGTPVNFSVVARDFFARLTERYLTYFLSRELSNELNNVGSNRQFREALSLHCKQASKIVEQFAAEWFSKANYQGGITPRKAAGFIGHGSGNEASEPQTLPQRRLEPPHKLRHGHPEYTAHVLKLQQIKAALAGFVLADERLLQAFRKVISRRRGCIAATRVSPASTGRADASPSTPRSVA